MAQTHKSPGYDLSGHVFVERMVQKKEREQVNNIVYTVLFEQLGLTIGNNWFSVGGWV